MDNNNIFNIYSWQFLNLMNSGEEVFYHKFLNEYLKLYKRINCIELTKKQLLVDIDSKIKELSKDKDELYAFSESLIYRIEKCSYMIKELFHFQDVKVIFFIGDGSIDGHGILIDKDSYAIYDISILYDMKDTYDLDVYLFHELIHAIHYMQSEFYYDRQRNLEEIYFKNIYSEGLATYLSWQGTFASLEEAYWFGYLEKMRIEKWIYNCENERANIGLRLIKSISSNTFDMGLYFELFNLANLHNYKNSRMAYYYGFEIVKRLSRAHSLENLLTLDYKIVREYIIDYFNI